MKATGRAGEISGNLFSKCSDLGFSAQARRRVHLRDWNGFVLPDNPAAWQDLRDLRLSASPSSLMGGNPPWITQTALELLSDPAPTGRNRCQSALEVTLLTGLGLAR
jgi:hypothetical protein